MKRILRSILLIAPGAILTMAAGPDEDSSRRFLERFLLASEARYAFAACRAAFSGYPQGVKLAIEGPVVLRQAASVARLPELKATYTTLAADLERFSHCMKGAGIAETSESWWRASSVVAAASQYCQDATILSADGALRLFFVSMLIDHQGKNASLTPNDKRLFTLLQPTPDQQVWDVKLVSTIATALYSPEGTAWLKAQARTLPQSELRRDVDDLLGSLQAPQADSGSIAFGIARVMLSNNLRFSRAATKALPKQ